MNTPFYTYLHLRPDGVPFYAGKGKGKRAHVLEGRGRWHNNVVEKYSLKNIIIRKVKLGLTEAQAFAHEVELIACLRAFNYDICNVTDGGEGISGCVHSEETRAKMSAAHVGLKHSDESRAKMSAVQKLQVVSFATRAKISMTMKGIVPSEASRAKMSAAKIGTIKSAETRAKMSAAHRKRWASCKKPVA